MRKALLRSALPGAVFVPFIGDGDLAVEHYAGRRIYGADLDPDRVVTASARLTNSVIRVADCNRYPFCDVDEIFAVADFDAYNDPYTPMRAFLTSAKTEKRIVLFGTDGIRQSVIRTGSYIDPRTGDRAKTDCLSDQRKLLNSWWIKVIRPYLIEAVRPRRIVRQSFYLRQWMLYWGIVCDG